MKTSRTNQLRVYPQRCSPSLRPDMESVASLPGLLKAFEEATGWSLTHHCGPKPIHQTEDAWSAPADPGVGTAPGHVRLDLARSASAASDNGPAPAGVRRLASALEDVLSELLATQQALEDREAELAAGVPVVVRSSEHNSLARRLHAVLHGGAEAVGCQAAALYLLDEGTTTLKLRSSWGLPRDRLTRPPRPLRGALADLEAMLGHAVVLEDTGLFQQWNPPESYPSAACVPISTPTTILGTLWVFCNSRRDFNDRETNILEVVAGRIASDLEREMLLQEGIDGAALKRQLAAAQRVQRNQLPTISPMIQGWDLAGWTAQGGSVGGNFHDWFSLPKGSVAFAVGDVAGQGIEAALIAGTLKAALRSHGQYHRNADGLLAQVNLTLWTGSAGDQSASLVCGYVDANTDRIRYGSAGHAELLLLRPDGWERLPTDFPPLGRSPESHYRQASCRIPTGSALLIFTGGFRTTPNRDASVPEAVSLAELLTPHLALPAKDIATAARSYAVDGNTVPQGDRTILVLKRTTP